MAFAPGQSGNPGGRPKADGTLRDLARSKAPAMLQVLIDIAENEEKAAPARVTAASAVLDRAYGKPPSTLGDENGDPMSWVALLEAARSRANG